jgi:hypothetical protein
MLSSIMNIDERESNLPKWARSDLAALRMRVAELEEHLAVAQGTSTTKATRVRIDGHPTRNVADRNLPTHSRITFVVGREERDTVTCYIDSDGIFTINGDDSILVQPWSSNVLKLTTGRVYDWVARS